MVGAVDVGQQAAAAADQLEQTATRGMIVLVLTQVLNNLVDALGQQGDLHLG